MSQDLRERTALDNFHSAAALVAMSGTDEAGADHILGALPPSAIISGLIDFVKVSANVIATNPGETLETVIEAIQDQVIEEQTATLSVELDLAQMG